MATLDCPNGKSVGMSINTSNNTANGSCDGLTTGINQKFTLTFSYDYNGTNVELASASKYADVNANSTTKLAFVAIDYVENFDMDGDGTSNLDEIKNGTDPTLKNFTLGGTINGVLGTVVLANGADQLTLSQDGSFTFPALPPQGSTYAVTVQTQPDNNAVGQTCRVINGSGTINGNVSNILVSCPQWIWEGGSQTSNASGNDNANAGTIVPGARDSVATWTDGSGNLWMFGGYGFDTAGDPVGALNDLWEYNPYSHTWNAINNTGTVNNLPIYNTDGTGTPGARTVPGAYWYDATSGTSGSLWLFGGYGYDTKGVFGRLNDLWRYDISTGIWHWVYAERGADDLGSYGTQGKYTSTNMPPGRYGAAAWFDKTNGQLWLFGGFGADTSNPPKDVLLDDMWQYDISTNEWIWISGSTSTNTNPNYPANPGDTLAGNDPGARALSTAWINQNNQLCLFGGQRFDATVDPTVSAPYQYTSDLWCYNNSQIIWTWVGGPNIGNKHGTYGTRGVADVVNNPGARNGASSWVDSSGQLWLFGGQGIDSALNNGGLSDLWLYDETNNQWTWMGGSDVVNTTSNFGTQGTANAFNSPGNRSAPAIWTDADGYYWLMGGVQYGASTSTPELNDIWMFKPNPLTLTIAGAK